MTTESDFQEAARHPALRQNFLNTIKLGDFCKCVRTILYSPESSLSYQFAILMRELPMSMSSGINRAFCISMPQNIKYPIKVYPSAFKLEGKNRLLDEFLSDLDHELFHCWDASTHPERFQIKFSQIFHDALRGYEITLGDRIRADCELRALAYEESRLNGRNVSEQYVKNLEELKNHWQTILDNYHAERQRKIK